MSMESVLKQLESRIEEFVEAYTSAQARVGELESRVEELERKAGTEAETAATLAAMERQRDELADRLQKVLGVIDGVLETGGGDARHEPE